MVVRRKPRVWNKYDKDVPADAVNIMRPSKWGNPFVIGADGTRDEVIEAYIMNADMKLIQMARRELFGRDLVCCCKPKKCHGDFLLAMANMRDGLWRVETPRMCMGFVLKDGCIVDMAPIFKRLLKNTPGQWILVAERVKS